MSLPTALAHMERVTTEQLKARKQIGIEQTTPIITTTFKEKWLVAEE